MFLGSGLSRWISAEGSQWEVLEPSSPHGHTASVHKTTPLYLPSLNPWTDIIYIPCKQAQKKKPIASHPIPSVNHVPPAPTGYHHSQIPSTLTAPPPSPGPSTPKVAQPQLPRIRPHLLPLPPQRLPPATVSNASKNTRIGRRLTPLSPRSSPSPDKASAASSSSSPSRTKP